MTPQSLLHLATRLERYDNPSCATAAGEVRRALQNAVRFDRADAEQALCHAIWGHLGDALESVGGAHKTELDALLGEMAGRVYMCRMALGWLTRAPGAPVNPPALVDLGL